MAALHHREVRHIILTVSRSSSPEQIFGEIRRRRAIARTMSALGSGRWLWVLEFHRGGWPHWHVLAENGGRMFRHDRISAAWGFGLVWESPIKSAQHWGAIMGYHKSKGYLAGENKGHQLELPPYLKSQSRVRKFGASYPDPGAKVTQESCHDERPTGSRVKRPARSYAERFGACDKEATVLVGDRCFRVDGNLAAVRAALEAAGGEKLDFGRYLLPQSDIPAFLAGGVTQ